MSNPAKSQVCSEFFAALLKHPRRVKQALARLPSLTRGLSFGHDCIECHKIPESPPRNPLPVLAHNSEECNLLRKYFDAHLTGRGIWKWEHYFDMYERHFRKYVGTEVHVVEIGIYSGGSLEMWRHYFGDRCHVYGVDIEQACHSYENDYTKIFIGDQASPEFWRSFKKEVPRVDVLIDDGGHQAFQQITTIEAMFSHIRPGGVYVCEDIHSEHNHFPSYLHGLTTQLNAFAMRSDGTVDTSNVQAWIQSIHNYPFATVIEKNAVPVGGLKAPRRGDSWQPFFD